MNQRYLNNFKKKKEEENKSIFHQKVNSNLLRKNEGKYNKKHVQNKAKSILEEESNKSEEIQPVFNRIKMNKFSLPNDKEKNVNVSSNNNSNFNSHLTSNQKTEETNNKNKQDNKNAKFDKNNISTNKLIKEVSKVIQSHLLSQQICNKSKDSIVTMKKIKQSKIPRPDNNLFKSKESAKISFKRRSQSADNHNEKYDNNKNSNQGNLRKESTYDESEIVTIKTRRKSINNNNKINKENSIKETNHERTSSAFEISQLMVTNNNNRTIERNFDFSIESHRYAKIAQQTNDKPIRTGAGSLMESSLLYPIVEKNVEFFIEEDTLIRNYKIQEHINNINQESIQSLNNIEIFSNNEDEINKLAESTINIVETSALNLKQIEESNKENFSIHYNSSLCNNTNNILITNSYAHNVTTKYDQSLINAIIKNSINEKEEFKKKLNFFSNENTIKKECNVKSTQIIDTVESINKENEKINKEPFIEVKVINFSLIPEKSNEDLTNELKDFVPKILNKQLSKKINFNTNLYRNNCRPSSTPNKLKKPHKNRISKSLEKLTPKNKAKKGLNKTDANNNIQENNNKRQINKTNSLNSIENYAHKYEKASAYIKKEIRKFSQESKETPIKKVENIKGDLQEKRFISKFIYRKPTEEHRIQKKDNKRVSIDEKKVISKTPMKNRKDIESKINQEIEKRSPIYTKEMNKNGKNNKIRGSSNVNVVRTRNPEKHSSIKELIRVGINELVEKKSKDDVKVFRIHDSNRLN